MNIDKFGHHVHKRLRLSDYIDTLNDTLLKTDAGHYDLKTSKLKGISSPTEDDEAVNKAYVDNRFQELKKEIKKVNDNLKIYLKNLENATSNHLSKSFYLKEEIDNLIELKLNKHNEQKKHS